MQQRNEKVAEPSMEDILASIRKIISEDPAPTKVAPDSTPASPNLTAAVTAARPASVQPAPRPPVQPAVAAPIAEAAPSRPAVPNTASAPAVTATSRLSDVMRELAPGAVPVGLAQPQAAFHDDLADLVDGDTEAAAPVAKATPSPLPAAPAFERPLAQPAPSPGLAVEPQPMSPPRPKAAAAPDFGSFIPASAEPIGMTSPRAIPLSIGADLRSIEPAKETNEPLLPRSFDLGMPVARPSAPPPSRVEAEPVAPVVEVAAEVPDPEDVPDPVAAAQSALGALAMGFATPTQTNVAVSENSPVELASSPPELVSFGDVPAAVSERRSLDDTIVDMLRPMIKDWLDDNLPDMVGKALHQELEERRRAKN